MRRLLWPLALLLAPSLAAAIPIHGTGPTHGAGGGGAGLVANSILEVHLREVSGVPVDEWCLTYEATVGDFEWQVCGGGTGAFSYTALGGGNKI